MGGISPAAHVHFGMISVLTQTEEQRSCRVIHADKIEDNFLFLGPTEVDFSYAFADDVGCSVSQVGHPKPN